MKEFNLAKEICKALESAEKDSRNNIYILKPEVIRREKIIERVLAETEVEISFDVVTNSIEISVLGYVFDSCVCDLKHEKNKRATQRFNVNLCSFLLF